MEGTARPALQEIVADSLVPTEMPLVEKFKVTAQPGKKVIIIRMKLFIEYGEQKFKDFWKMNLERKKICLSHIYKKQAI